MKESFLNDLNSEQQQAVIWTDGPIIILAGAGSGKTRVLTYKVLYLVLKKNINPTNILMVTFTNKAANEMKERINKHLSTKSHLPTVATFHSLCAKILRIDGYNIGISNKFVIYDEADQKDAVKEVLKKLNLSIKDFKPNSVLATISQAKNQLINSTEYLKYARGYFQETVARIYPLYNSLLKTNDGLDFDDLLLKTVELFEKNPSILDRYQNKFRYILVDEYQDTNHAQYILTKRLAKKSQNICVVGDFSQSIYSWRGADFQNLIKFKEDFQNTKTFSLSQNYRSSQNILDAASSVIAKNSTHPVLSLWTENDKGDEVLIYEARNEQDEIQFIIRAIQNICAYNSSTTLSDIALLYRTNAQSRVVEEVFLHEGIPYILIGGTRFYERREIKDVLSYLRLLSNPKDMVSYKRIEKLGKGRLSKFIDFQAKLDNTSTQATIDLLDETLKATAYLSLYDEKDEEDRTRLENIKELRSVALEFPNLTEFLENVALVEQEYTPDKRIGQKDRKDAITLMTMHAAKGLEFKAVFMVGMEEGLFPHSRALMDKYELEEERRLCYVGMTRAREKLFLTYARRRLYFGQKSVSYVSRFIMELPETMISKNHLTQSLDDNTPEYL